MEGNTSKSTKRSAKIHLDTVKISMLLVQQHMTQKQLAHYVGVTEASMSRYMNGNRLPRLGTLQMMADTLGVRLSELMRSGDPKAYGRIKVILDEGAFAPVRAHDVDAGLDILSPRDILVPAMDSRTIDTGVHVEIPEGYAGFLKSKSGLNVNHGITSEGVIDAGYQGSIRVKLYNHSREGYMVHRQDKISQLVILPVLLDDIEIVDAFDVETERGENGFGSTGR